MESTLEPLDDTFAMPASLIRRDGSAHPGRALVVREHDVTSELKVVRGSFWFDERALLADPFEEWATALLRFSDGAELEISAVGGSFSVGDEEPARLDFVDRRNLRD